MLRIEYHDDLNIVQGDAELTALLDPHRSSAPFDRIDWWSALAEECGISPLLAVARDESAIAVLALRKNGSQLEALANWYTFRARPVCSDDGKALLLLTAIAADLAGRTKRISLFPLPDENGEAALLDQAFRAAGWTVFREASDCNHYLEVNGRSFAEYLAARPGPLRTTLKRKANKVSVRLTETFSDTDWDIYEAIYRQSWKPEEGVPAFLRRFAREEAAAGRMRLGFAYAGDEPVATQFWTVEGGCAFIHKLAHTETSKPLSPGTTLSAALFEMVIDRDKVQSIDFGTGNDSYKRDWMEQVRSRYRLDLYRPGHPGNWPVLARKVMRRLARKSNHG